MKPGLTVDDLRAIHDRYPVDEADVRAALSRVPPSWTLIEEIVSGAAFRRGSLQVLFSVEKHEDLGLWLHASVCGRKGPGYYLPNWEELKRVKHDFIGPDRWAYQVLPDQREYVNDNPYVLHLYSRYDGTPALPDFTRGLGTL